MARDIQPFKFQIHAATMKTRYGHQLSQHTLVKRSLLRMHSWKMSSREV
jgi:hypothetical protein